MQAMTFVVQAMIVAAITWAFTYLYMDRKVSALKETVQFLDIYIEEMEDKYGDVMDDYTDYYLDQEW